VQQCVSAGVRVVGFVLLWHACTRRSDPCSCNPGRAVTPAAEGSAAHLAQGLTHRQPEQASGGAGAHKVQGCGVALSCQEAGGCDGAREGRVAWQRSSGGGDSSRRLLVGGSARVCSACAAAAPDRGTRHIRWCVPVGRPWLRVCAPPPPLRLLPRAVAGPLTAAPHAAQPGCAAAHHTCSDVFCPLFPKPQPAAVPTHQVARRWPPASLPGCSQAPAHPQLPPAPVMATDNSDKLRVSAPQSAAGLGRKCRRRRLSRKTRGCHARCRPRATTNARPTPSTHHARHTRHASHRGRRLREQHRRQQGSEERS
jgi:hypothetical protein